MLRSKEFCFSFRFRNCNLSESYVPSFCIPPDDVNVYIYETYCATKTSNKIRVISETS